MIPNDHWNDNGDGTAAFVKHTPGHVYDRPCDACGGSGTHTVVHGQDAVDHYDTTDIACPDCHGRKRHTFTVELECFNNGEYFVCPKGSTCSPKCGGWGTLIVHVIDVLEIVEFQGENITTDSVEIDGKYANVWVGDEIVAIITLPPAAEPGMWLVRLAVHS